MQRELDGAAAEAGSALGGLAGWLLARLRAGRREPSRLAVLERIALAQRHSLTLVEADGRRLLVATSPDGPAAFFPLDDPALRPPPAPPVPLPRSPARFRERAERDARVSC